MATPQRFIHDRVVLLLLSVNIFFTVLISVLIAFALTGGTDRLYVIEHRPSLGLSANRIGDSTQMTSLIVFVIFVLVFNTMLSVRSYPLRRNFAVVVLGMGTLLILLAGVISSFLLQK
ncbi:MAG: hypothetical protein V4702_02670 [Patescibacteria group bacterium]